MSRFQSAFDLLIFIVFEESGAPSSLGWSCSECRCRWAGLDSHRVDRSTTRWTDPLPGPQEGTQVRAGPRVSDWLDFHCTFVICSTTRPTAVVTDGWNGRGDGSGGRCVSSSKSVRAVVFHRHMSSFSSSCIATRWLPCLAHTQCRMNTIDVDPKKCTIHEQGVRVTRHHDHPRDRHRLRLPEGRQQVMSRAASVQVWTLDSPCGKVRAELCVLLHDVIYFSRAALLCCCELVISRNVNACRGWRM